MREDQAGADVPGKVAQVPIVPGRLDALERARRFGLPVPADAEAVAVRRLGSEPRVQALVDQRMGGLVEELLQQNRRPRVREPAAHVVSPSDSWCVEAVCWLRWVERSIAPPCRKTDAVASARAGTQHSLDRSARHPAHMKMPLFDRFSRKHAGASDARPRRAGPAVVQIDATALSRVFSAPMWLRDLGLLAWFLVGVGLVLFGLVWLLALTSTIVDAGARRRDPGHGCRPSRHEDASPRLSARCGRRRRPARAHCARRRDRAARVRRALRAVVGDQGRRLGGCRQGAGVARRRRDRRTRIRPRATPRAATSQTGATLLQGRRRRDPGADVADLLPDVLRLQHVLPAQGRTDRAAASSTGAWAFRLRSRTPSPGT